MKNDLVASILGGLCLEFDPMVCNIASKKKEITLQDAQFLLMGYESRLEQYHSTATIDISQALANTAFKYANFARGDQFSNNRGRSRGRRGSRGGRYYNQRFFCQLYGKTDHFSAICYYRFDRSFAGNFGKKTHRNCFFTLLVLLSLLVATAHILSNSVLIHTALIPPDVVFFTNYSVLFCHPIVTRSKNGIFKPKYFLSFAPSQLLPSTVDVPVTVSTAFTDPKWTAAMKAKFAA
ncbi:hypothetical protein ACOSQ2_031131 [Xanthoceras sorbifolium]